MEATSRTNDRPPRAHGRPVAELTADGADPAGAVKDLTERIRRIG